MTPDERALLQTFLTDLVQTPQITKDTEADAMISDAVRQNPNALYLLVQHAIIADQALHQAQAQIQQLQSQGAPAPSFLSPAQPWSGPQGQLVQSSPFSAGGGLGSFLRTAGTMAAGVAGGDFIARGIENIFSPRW